MFDRTTRERAWLLYAWCRRADDIADGQELGGAMIPVEDAHARLAEIRTKTDAALDGRTVGDAAFDGLAIVVAETRLPRQFIDDVIEGFALDADGWRPRHEDDMLRYCYHVAGAVGRAMAVIMGVDPQDEDTLDRATDLGIAFQLANIARDIGEDDAAGRCYLPEDWLVEADIPPGEHMRPHFRSRLADMAWWLANMVGDYEASARIGAARLPFRARWAVLAAAGIYGDIAREVDRLDQAAWDRRVVISRRRKLAWVARALVQARQKPIDVPREGLWTHGQPKPRSSRTQSRE